ncbi:hypothetical protein [Nonomuraea basaltis]|uniref:hypothetical protein n=1 Tax=Nonomuraea basaltis TaxID=2495887 RepID=UPI00110C5D43|nr:hypothetical protein [Nonomuraea basaltis]TMR96045.1 hypothetical protein EJK15_25495 [Nonomuraea basaltis]
MSIKETGLAFCTAIENEVIQIRADQQELAQDLTERINGVANRVKALDAKFDTRFDALEKAMQENHKTAQENHTKVMDILVGIQRKLEAA